ncbi:hypothetical protein CGMCC3_g6184 [Colletotrichum fructicola]|nr:uncharacterized protein CGMCC3_g6184 [Colletotrichum fructicola]KAE9577881.1 hypothetical protein CGMCC3_g6184 [Colletotrichum fructicola]
MDGYLSPKEFAMGEAGTDTDIQVPYSVYTSLLGTNLITAQLAQTGQKQAVLVPPRL